ncbi:hypothetical protein [Paenimyroides aestuarii]|uniref:Uncharacterized protein n=1 Tax=Paenimyroides aestuarii TaxID=2968490 RepID=A0ABY5NT86_9FLAO|nr:hypothetical protein [Paenimyroides aestuarii]UUV21612.1 hypothetical protein NPX36_00740 [Paenimyroides aestuarii]
MKSSFLKYYFLLIALLFASMSNYANQMHILQNGSESGFLKYQNTAHTLTSQKKVANHFDKKAHKQVHLGKIKHIYVNHYKADFSETEFELQNESKIQKVKVLLKAFFLYFLVHIPTSYHSKKSVQIVGQLSTFYSYLKNQVFISLLVIRL